MIDSIDLVSSNYQHTIHCSFTVNASLRKEIHKWSDLKDCKRLWRSYVGLRRNMTGTMEKNLPISADSGNLKQWHFEIYFCFILSSWTNYIGWVFDYTLFGVWHYPLYFEYTRRYLGYYNFLYNFQINEWPCRWYITSWIIVSYINWGHVGLQKACLCLKILTSIKYFSKGMSCL